MTDDSTARASRHLPAPARPRRAALADLRGRADLAPARAARRRSREEQLGAALAYLEVLWVDACLRAAETDAAYAELDAATAARPDSSCTTERAATTRRCGGCATRSAARVVAADRAACTRRRAGAHEHARPEPIAYAAGRWRSASTCSRTPPTPTAPCPPREVVERAAEAGVELLALSDHDTVSGVSEAIAAGERVGVRVVPAVEISAVDDGAPAPARTAHPRLQHRPHRARR